MDDDRIWFRLHRGIADGLLGAEGRFGRVSDSVRWRRTTSRRLLDDIILLPQDNPLVAPSFYIPFYVAAPVTYG